MIHMNLCDFSDRLYKSEKKQEPHKAIVKADRDAKLKIEKDRLLQGMQYH